MEKLQITPRSGWEARFWDESTTLHIGFRSSVDGAFQGGSFDYDQVTKIVEAGQQWLKENPKKVDGWLNVYPNLSSSRHNTKVTADEEAGTARIACIPISYHIGEGLDTPEEQDD